MLMRAFLLIAWFGFAYGPITMTQAGEAGLLYSMPTSSTPVIIHGVNKRAKVLEQKKKAATTVSGPANPNAQYTAADSGGGASAGGGGGGGSGGGAGGTAGGSSGSKQVDDQHSKNSQQIASQNVTVPGGLPAGYNGGAGDAGGVGGGGGSYPMHSATAAQTFLQGFGVNFHATMTTDMVNDMVTNLHVHLARLQMPFNINSSDFVRVARLMDAGVSPLLTLEHETPNLIRDINTANTLVPNMWQGQFANYACRPNPNGVGAIGECYTSQIDAYTRTAPFTNAAWQSDGIKNVIEALNARPSAKAAIHGLEGPNEFAGYSHNFDPDAHVKLHDYMMDILNSVRNTPSLQNLLIVNSTLDPSMTAALLTNRNQPALWQLQMHPEAYVPSYADFAADGNTRGANHNYASPFPFPGGTDPVPQSQTQTLSYTFARQALPQFEAAKMEVTEFGYTTCQSNPGFVPCVTEDQQADYIPLRFVELWELGHRAIYQYDYVDDGAADSFENRSGFLRADLSKKPSYYSMKNLMSHFVEQGAADNKGLSSISYLLTAAANKAAWGNDVGDLVFKRNDGTFVIVLYRRPATALELKTPAAVNLAFPKPVEYKTYDLRQEAAVASGNSKGIDVSVKTISIIEIKP